MNQTEKQPLMTSDAGTVIYNKNTNRYYCGMSTFHKDLRKAMVYHSAKQVAEVIAVQKKQHPEYDLQTLPVTMHITQAAEKDTSPRYKKLLDKVNQAYDKVSCYPEEWELKGLWNDITNILCEYENLLKENN